MRDTIADKQQVLQKTVMIGAGMSKRRKER